MYRLIFNVHPSYLHKSTESFNEYKNAANAIETHNEARDVFNFIIKDICLKGLHIPLKSFEIAEMMGNTPFLISSEAFYDRRWRAEVRVLNNEQTLFSVAGNEYTIPNNEQHLNLDHKIEALMRRYAIENFNDYVLADFRIHRQFELNNFSLENNYSYKHTVVSWIFR